MTHELKTDPIPFAYLRANRKKFEIRFDDRMFMEGDFLCLNETRFTGTEMADGKPLEYTHRVEVRQVTHIMRGPIYGLAEG